MPKILLLFYTIIYSDLLMYLFFSLLSIYSCIIDLPSGITYFLPEEEMSFSIYFIVDLLVTNSFSFLFI